MALNGSNTSADWEPFTAKERCQLTAVVMAAQKTHKVKWFFKTNKVRSQDAQMGAHKKKLKGTENMNNKEVPE